MAGLGPEGCPGHPSLRRRDEERRGCAAQGWARWVRNYEGWYYISARPACQQGGKMRGRERRQERSGVKSKRRRVCVDALAPGGGRLQHTGRHCGEGGRTGEIDCQVHSPCRNDLLNRIELRRASLFEIAEFEDAGAKLRKPAFFGQSETAYLLRSLFVAGSLDLAPIMLAIPLPIGPMLHLINPFRLHGNPPIPCVGGTVIDRFWRQSGLTMGLS